MSQFETVRRIVADVLETTPDKISPTTVPDELAQWDSIRHMNIILSLEAELGIEFSEQDIEAMTDIPQILAVLAGKG
jgi:acyl carrier protein